LSEVIQLGLGTLLLLCTGMARTIQSMLTCAIHCVPMPGCQFSLKPFLGRGLSCVTLGRFLDISLSYEEMKLMPMTLERVTKAEEHRALGKGRASFLCWALLIMILNKISSLVWVSPPSLGRLSP
jgi:hypothetical protein